MGFGAAQHGQARGNPVKRLPGEPCAERERVRSTARRRLRGLRASLPRRLRNSGPRVDCCSERRRCRWVSALPSTDRLAARSERLPGEPCAERERVRSTTRRRLRGRRASLPRRLRSSVLVSTAALRAVVFDGCGAAQHGQAREAGSREPCAEREGFRSTTRRRLRGRGREAWSSGSGPGGRRDGVRRCQARDGSRHDAKRSA